MLAVRLQGKLDPASTDAWIAGRMVSRKADASVTALSRELAVTTAIVRG
jgi:hypothetical protein